MAAVAHVERVFSPRLLAGMPGTIAVDLSVAGVDAPDPAAATTCTVRDALGVTMASGAAELVAGASRLQFNLTGAQTAANIGVLTATWSGFTFAGEAGLSLTSEHEVIGDFPYTIEQLRAYEFQGAGLGFGDVERYPDVRVREIRDRIIDQFSDVLGVPVGRRGLLETLDGTGTDTVELSAYFVTAVRAVQTRSGTTWTSWSAGDLADLLVYRDGRLVRDTLGTWPAGRRNVRVLFECGLQPVPAELRQAALHLASYAMVAGGVNERAISQTDENGTFSLSVAGRGSAIVGIPAVDEVLNRFAGKLRGHGVGFG